jgi:hypothetical protein
MTTIRSLFATRLYQARLGDIDADELRASCYSVAEDDDAGNAYCENDDDPRLSDDGTAQLDSINISDFDNREDIIVIDGTASSDAYTFSTARLETFTDRFEEPYTALILRYDSETEDNRDVVVGLGAGSVTLDDITFTGDQTPMTFTDMR